MGWRDGIYFDGWMVIKGFGLEVRSAASTERDWTEIWVVVTP
jgi:hypothetical protein